MNSQNLFSRTLTAAAVALCTLTSFGQQVKCVKVQGQVHVNEGHPGNASVTLTLNGQTPEAIPVTRKGAYRIYLPEGRTAQITFAMEGHASKTISIDAANSFNEVGKWTTTKRVDMDVVLQTKEDTANDQVSNAGTIRFMPEDGMMHVTYESDQQPLGHMVLIAADLSTQKF